MPRDLSAERVGTGDKDVPVATGIKFLGDDVLGMAGYWLSKKLLRRRQVSSHDVSVGLRGTQNALICD